MSVVTGVLQGSTQYRIGSFVGYAMGRAINGNSVSLDITNGSNFPVDVHEGDLIITAIARGGTGDNASSMSTSGYSKILSEFSNDTNDTNLDVFVKISDGTETTIASASTGQTADSVIFCAMVFRGVQQIKYLLAREQVNTDDPRINDVSDLNYGNICVVIGAAAHVLGEGLGDQFEQGGDLEDFQTLSESDTYDITFGMGYRRITNETGYAPSAMIGDLSGASSGTCSAILVLD
jgi:hypothetical protein